MDDAEDAVGADENPRVNRIAAIVGVANKSVRIDGVEATVRQPRAGSTAIHFGLVDVDAFLILGGRTGRSREGGARPSRETVAGGYLWGIKVSGIGDIVIDAREGRAAAGDDRD